MNGVNTNDESRMRWSRWLAMPFLAAVALLSFQGDVLAQEGGEVTFSRDVAPILQENCQQCHQEGAIGPMSLMTHSDARSYARRIRDKVSQRLIPPWHGNPHIGLQNFKNDGSLTEERNATIMPGEGAGRPECGAASRARPGSLALERDGAEYAGERGIIIADTKSEFGLLDADTILIDEMLTADSSRFWDAAQHEPGRHEEALDKQFVRDWLLQSGWDREPPPPELPPDVVEETSRLYREVYQRLTGEEVRA